MKGLDLSLFCLCCQRGYGGSIYDNPSALSFVCTEKEMAQKEQTGECPDKGGRYEWVSWKPGGYASYLNRGENAIVYRYQEGFRDYRICSACLDILVGESQQNRFSVYDYYLLTPNEADERCDMCQQPFYYL